MKNLKKKENKLDYTVTIDTPPSSDTTDTDTHNVYSQYYGHNDSNLPHSLRNRKFTTFSTITMKNHKKK